MTDNGRQELRAAVAGYLHHAFERETKLWRRFEENLAQAEAAQAAAQETPFVEGSTGQLTAHPGFGVAGRCDELALKFYRELTAGQDEAFAGIARRPR